MGEFGGLTLDMLKNLKSLIYLKVSCLDGYISHPVFCRRGLGRDKVEFKDMKGG